LTTVEERLSDFYTRDHEMLFTLLSNAQKLQNDMAFFNMGNGEMRNPQSVKTIGDEVDLARYANLGPQVRVLRAYVIAVSDSDYLQKADIDALQCQIVFLAEELNRAKLEAAYHPKLDEAERLIKMVAAVYLSHKKVRKFTFSDETPRRIADWSPSITDIFPPEIRAVRCKN